MERPTNVTWTTSNVTWFDEYGYLPDEKHASIIYNKAFTGARIQLQLLSSFVVHIRGHGKHIDGCLQIHWHHGPF